MKDLISREALLQRIGEKLNVLRGCNDFKEAWGMRYAMVMIQNAPAVDAVEVKHGRWKNKQTNSIFTWHLECSVCGADYNTPVGYNYCPNCGARMQGGSDE